MRPIANFAVHALAATALIAFAASGAAAAADMYLKLGAPKGEASKGSHGQIEIESFSWGETRAAGGNVEYSWKVEEGESAPPPPDGWIADVERPQAARRLPGKRTPPTVTLKRGTSAAERGKKGSTASGQPTGKRQYASIQGGPEGASGLPTGKRQHKPMVLARPLDRGSLTVKGSLPGCAVGARYPDAVLQTAAGRYELRDVTVTGCGPGGVSLNYIKVQEVTIKKSMD